MLVEATFTCHTQPLSRSPDTRAGRTFIKSGVWVGPEGDGEAGCRAGREEQDHLSSFIRVSRTGHAVADASFPCASLGGDALLDPEVHPHARGA